MLAGFRLATKVRKFRFAFRETKLRALDTTGPIPASALSATVRIVDDDANLDVLGGMLRPNFDVVLGSAVLRTPSLQIASSPPDLILFDVVMPGMGSHDMLTHLRDKPATRDIPFIFVTGQDSTEDEETSIERAVRGAMISARIDKSSMLFSPASRTLLSWQ